MPEHRLSSRLALCVLLGCWLLASSGCQPRETAQPSPDEPALPSVSDVPLRLWVVAPIPDPSILKRQWLAASDQPVEIRSLDVQTLLAGQDCQCDVLLFPSRLMGELIQRDWIVKLPQALLEESGNDADATSVGVSAVADAQTLHGGVPFAVSLGRSVPATVASDAMAKRLGATTPTWKEILEQFEAQAAPEPFEESQVDEQAIVDRYLAILATQVTQNSQYGLLFEMQSMTPRFSQPEFVEAAKILVALLRQPGGAPSVIGSHDDAWKWATQNETAVVAIASPTLVGDEAAAITTGKILDLASAAPVKGWNTGAGMVAALSAGCRQSSRATEMLRWFQQSQTRNAIAPMILGIDSTTPGGSADSLSWIARRKAQESMQAASLPQEPSLPHAEEYRGALAVELVQLLRGEKTAKQAMQAVDQAWQKITGNRKAQHRTAYEKSLGLSL